MRGEHHLHLHHRDGGGGSSPHARGARRLGVAKHNQVGIIPACAGSTALAACPRRSRRDHPRMRGEHALRFPPLKYLQGSSPHARGALDVVAVEVGPYGIIPACAGSTPASRPPRSSYRDHPRMRGEHSHETGACDFVRGSSPHARGAPALRGEGAVLPGIIPACAGSTASSAVVSACRGDHPRMRGEHAERHPQPPILAGSSPHARGAL